MNNTNTKFPNHHILSNNKFGVVLPQMHSNVVKPSQVPTSKPSEDNEKEVELSEVYEDNAFYSKDDLIKYESSPIQNIPQVSKPQGVFDVYRYLKK